MKYSFLNTPSFLHLLSNSPCHLISKRNLFLYWLILLSGDVESNLGPRPASSIFNVCAFNIRSLTNDLHYTALASLAQTHNVDILALTETWISPNTTLAELVDSIPHGFYLVLQDLLPLLKLLLLVAALHSLFMNHCLSFRLLHLHSSLSKFLLSLSNSLDLNSLSAISIVHLLPLLYHVINLLSPSFWRTFNVLSQPLLPFLMNL
jgi:hypothetical protein